MTVEQLRHDSLEDTVISGGYCIGCGSCTTVEGSPFSVELDSLGRYQAKNVEKGIYDLESVKAVCPFSSSSTNENAIAESLYQDKDASHDEQIGWSIATYAGHVAEGKFREQGSSGGMGTWIALELLRSGEIDGLAHVIPTHKELPLFTYRIARSEMEILEGAKSRYYPIEMSQILQEIQQTPGRYAVVGIPCFIKAVRLLAQVDPIINERVKYTISLFCGHLKSTRFSQLFAWQCGIAPNSIETIDFRKKLPGRPASHYGVEVTEHKSQLTETKPTTELFGSNWGHGFFKYNACDYCDDVVGETADISIGDAWLPEYVNDSLGTNVVIVRHPRIHSFILSAIEQNRLSLLPLSTEDVIKSQEGGFRHRREGLSFRLFLKDQEEMWRPCKRVNAAENHLSKKDKKKYLLRMQLASTSHKAFDEALSRNSLTYFMDAMKQLIEDYESLYQPSIYKKIVWKLQKIAIFFVTMMR